MLRKSKIITIECTGCYDGEGSLKLTPRTRTDRMESYDIECNSCGKKTIAIFKEVKR